MSSKFLDQLNDVQREAAENIEGSSLIIAGAGSGKTRVLTFRIAYMIDQGIKPYSILALTFTNKAAKEMRERIAAIVDPYEAGQIWMGTFHSVFAKILRSEAAALGFNSSFTIYDSSDSQNLVKTIIKEMNLSDEKYKPRNVSSRISLSKNNLVTPAAYASNSSLLAEDRECAMPQFIDIYRTYMVRCKANNAMDFDDLLLYTNILFRDFPDVAAKYQQKFKYILVDEYQDTNVAQYLIIKKIAGRHGNLAVVGDDAQSIYSFRGAKIENILRFQKDYPSAKIYKLEQNYRSTQTIVNAANSVISKNANQLKKKSFSAGNVGEKIKLYKLYTDKEESAAVARDIVKLMSDNGSLTFKDFAILYRTNAQSRTFEDAFRQRSIPYRIYGGFSFYQRAEIKNMLAYARVVVNCGDNEALNRIINFPARGIGDATIAKIAQQATEKGLQNYNILEGIVSGEVVIKGVAAPKIKLFMEALADISGDMATSDAYQVMNKIAYRSGILAHYQATKSVENQSAIKNIEELLNSLKQQSDQRAVEGMEPLSLGEWLESVVLITTDEDEESDDKVTLMTIHSAKGLEFKNVFIVGLEEGLFPSENSTSTLQDIEEERRLFYVAITRAVERLSISLCQNRYKWGSFVSSSPSRFIEEIDQQYLDIEDCEDEYNDKVSSGFDDDDEFSSRSSFSQSWGSKQKSSSSQNYRGGYGSSSYGSSSYGSSSYGSSSYGSKGGGSPKPKPISARRESAPITIEQPKVAIDTSKFKRVVSSPTSPSRAADENQIHNIVVGSKVEHQVFGKGVVMKCDRGASDTKLTITFEGIGDKNLLLKYAKLKVL